MHYWGYVMEQLLNDDQGRRSRRARSSRRATRAQDP